MDYASCHIVYIDRRVVDSRYWTKSTVAGAGESAECAYVRQNLKVLLEVFHGVHLCSSGEFALAKIRELDSIGTDCTPTLAFFETSLPSSKKDAGNAPGESHSLMPLIEFMNSARGDSNISRLSVVISALGPANSRPIEEPDFFPGLPSTLSSDADAKYLGEHKAVQTEPEPADIDREQIISCLKAGAVDAIPSPFTKHRVEALATHAYRAHIDGLNDQSAYLVQKNSRKRSWVGIDEEKPYAYLREEMVSNLMGNICKPDIGMSSTGPRKSYSIDDDRAQFVAEVIGKWGFPAHDLSEDELVHAAFLMLQHALDMPELEKWRISTDDLTNFLIACRSAYNAFVLYHNFRHVVDVLQAVFFFLVQLGTLPPYPANSTPQISNTVPSPIAALLKPFDAFVLLVSAVGHDVGHPGVNNAFLVALKAPLAQLYNDNSVLEAFHCAAYSQILRRYWNLTFNDVDLRRLLIKSILATDMQMHFKYMADLGNLQEKLHHNKGTDGWSPQILEEYKTLACGLLIKCADISNVARPFQIAAKWSDILQLEFARQGEMENDVGIPTTLFGGPPELGNITKLANSQIGFMNIFAMPLFEAVTDILPGMRFAVDEIKINQAVWKEKIDEQETKQQRIAEQERFVSEGYQSPRSGSPDRMFANSNSPTMSHPEGLPAASTSPKDFQPEASHIADHPNGEQGIMTVRDTNRNVAEQQSRISTSSLSGLTEALNISSPQSHEPSRRGSAAQPPTLFPDMSRRSSSAFPYANIRGPGHHPPTQLVLNSNTTNNHNQTTNENATPDRSPPVLSSPFNENVFYDNSSVASTAPGTASSSGGGPGSSHRGDRGADSDTSTSQLTHPGNFSRPMSTRHSAQPSCARSSAPSGGTYASTTLPTSPTDTHATSFFTEGSDGVPDAPDSLNLERPGSGTRFSGYRGRGINASPVTNDIKTGVLFSSLNGHSDSPERTVRKKSSRFRFDFWKKNRKGGELSP